MASGTIATAEHAGGLRGVGIELVALDHAYAVIFPGRRGGLRAMGMRFAMVMMVMVLVAHGDLLQRRLIRCLLHSMARFLENN
jgi:hypothetical protein